MHLLSNSMSSIHTQYIIAKDEGQIKGLKWSWYYLVFEQATGNSKTPKLNEF